jgi:uncharacterized SAM-binding protein YcdF (DUF218 family)
MYDIYFFLVSLLRPYTLCVLLTAAGLAYTWWRCPAARRRLCLALVPFGALVLLSLPCLAHLEMGSLEWPYPPLREPPAHVEALVVLGGGVFPADAVRARPQPTEDSLYRCLYAAALYRQVGGCPIVVTGGRVDGDPREPSCAAVMRDFLLEIGVSAADVTTEEESRTTYENAVGCRDLLERRGVHRVVLVTDAGHMLRGERCFRRQGFDVVPAPCNQQATVFHLSAHQFVPSAEALGHSEYAWHEWVGALWYWCRGRM